MTLTLNGKPHSVSAGASVSELLAACDLAGKPCAVEVNDEVVPHREHGERRLSEGDRVEIVTLVGGG